MMKNTTTAELKRINEEERNEMALAQRDIVEMNGEVSRTIKNIIKRLEKISIHCEGSIACPDIDGIKKTIEELEYLEECAETIKAYRKKHMEAFHGITATREAIEEEEKTEALMEKIRQARQKGINSLHIMGLYL